MRSFHQHCVHAWDLHAWHLVRERGSVAPGFARAVICWSVRFYPKLRRRMSSSQAPRRPIKEERVACSHRPRSSSTLFSHANGWPSSRWRRCTLPKAKALQYTISSMAAPQTMKIHPSHVQGERSALWVSDRRKGGRTFPLSTPSTFTRMATSPRSTPPKWLGKTGSLASSSALTNPMVVRCLMHVTRTQTFRFVKSRQ